LVIEADAAAPGAGRDSAVRQTWNPAQFRAEMGPCEVLLAEDGPDNQRLISHILTKAGANVTLAENGRAAVDRALAAKEAGKPFDIILMDMQMPILDGYGATAELRERGYEGLIVALTAHAMAGDREKCRAAGCDDYFTKPIDRPALVALVASVAGQPAER
jgi:CheY-like chemotaxis protein